MLTQEQQEEVRLYYLTGEWMPEDIADTLDLDETDVMDFCAELLYNE